MIHNKNTSVLTILPSLGPGLLITRKRLDVLRSFLESSCKDNSSGLEHQLNHAKKGFDKLGLSKDELVLGLDEEKSFILAHSFPEHYTGALALLTNKAIYFEIWGKTDESPKIAIDQYMSGEKEHLPVFVRVKSVEEKKKNTDKTVEDHQCAAAEFNRLLQPLGYTYDSHTKKFTPLDDHRSTDCTKILWNITEEEGPLPRNSFVHTDPYSWFCSCSEYLKALSEQRSCLTIGREITEPVQQKLNCGKSNAIFSFLLNSHCFHPNSLAICRHLLALLLAALNWDTVCAHGLISIARVTGVVQNDV